MPPAEPPAMGEPKRIQRKRTRGYDPARNQRWRNSPDRPRATCHPSKPRLACNRALGFFERFQRETEARWVASALKYLEAPCL